MPTARRRPRPSRARIPAEPIWDIIELLFFAYRDFVSDPDDVLAKFSFGRAHHRVLHFVNRHPGMKVADLLDVLKITKQSLGRVLKQLVDQGYVRAEGGRERSPPAAALRHAEGRALAMKLAGLQTERIARALGETRPERARGRAPLPRRHDRRRRPRRRAEADRPRRPRAAAAVLIAAGRSMAPVPVPIPPADDAPHLLVVDDDRRIRDLLSRFLSTEGYRITTAGQRGDGARQARQPAASICSSST